MVKFKIILMAYSQMSILSNNPTSANSLITIENLNAPCGRD